MATDYSDYEFLKVEVTDRVATITINRPESLNAVNNVVHHELEQIWIDVRADRDVGRDLDPVADVQPGAARVGAQAVAHSRTTASPGGTTPRRSSTHVPDAVSAA